MSELRKIPGVGKAMERDLINIGISEIAGLRGQDPEELYARHNMYKGFTDDRCVLYVFRCAVYFAETENPDPEKLRWWYWKGHEYKAE